MKVLLVEDSAADARLFAELLGELAGRSFEVTTVGTLADAIEALRVAPTRHDVVFLDLSLPDAHGLATVTRMVNTARHLPIVVLTGNDDDQLAVDAMKAGAQDYLTKAELTPSLIARTARYAVERKGAEENAHKVAKADEATRRARFLSSVTAALTASLDLQVMLGDVARLMVPTLGDDVALDVVQDAQDASDKREAEIVERAGRSTLSVPLLARGRVVGTLSLTMGASGRTFDVELRQLIDEVAERIALGIDNASLYAAAQRAIYGRDELLAVVSHDLRNPLNLVGLALQMIEQDPSELAMSLPSAKRGVDRMQRLIEDLLDVARIEAGTLTVEPAPVSLGSLLEDAYEQHRVLAADKHITLAREFDRHTGGVLADRHRMGQALSNVIGNALKFTPPGGSIRIGGESRGERAVIWIADTGPGIAKEHVAHIFDRFWQPTRGRHGVGLGLAIVKGIVEAHGGAIEVESVPGQGTTFRLLMRAADARATGEMAPLAVAR